MDVDVALGAERRRWTIAGCAFAALSFWMVATSFKPFRLFWPGVVNSNFYDLQAHRLLAGHLTVPKGSLGVEEFVTANGSHMYFGIVPALLRLPIAAFTHSLDGRLAQCSQLIAVVVLGAFTARLARKAQVLLQVEGDDLDGGAPWYAFIAAAPVVASPVLFLAAGGYVYHEAILWGAAGALWGLDAVLTWWLRRGTGRLVLAVVAGAFALGSRPSTGLAPIVALATCGAVLIVRRDRRAGAWAVVGSVVAFVSYAAVNFARFHLVFGAPTNLQASFVSPVQQQAYDQTGGAMASPAYFVSAVAHYFSPSLGVMRPARLFPFVQWGPLPTPVFSKPQMYIEPTGSIPTSAPLLLLFAIVGVVVLARWRGIRTWWLVVPAVFVPVIVTMSYFAMCHRYLVDLVPMLVVVGLPGFWASRRWLMRRSKPLRRGVIATLGVVAVVGALGQAGLAIWTRAFYLWPDVNQQANFVRFQYQLDAHLFDSPPPHVVHTDGKLEPDVIGNLVVVGDCDAVYLRATAGWVPLERYSGGSRRVVLIADAAMMSRIANEVVPVATGTLWRLEMRPGTDDRYVQLHYVRSDGIDVPSDPILLDGRPLLLDIVADPTTVTVQVRNHGHLVLDLYANPAWDLRAAPPWPVLPGGDTFCRLITRTTRPPLVPAAPTTTAPQITNP